MIWIKMITGSSHVALYQIIRKMSTIANSKSSYLKRLEILQSASHESECTLESEFLSKPENYTLSLAHLLLDITPTINLMKGPYLEVLRRPTYLETLPEDSENLETVDNMAVVANSAFLPVNPKTVLDVVSQLYNFCELHNGLSIKLNGDMSIKFDFTTDFGDAHYLKLHTDFATLLELPEYIYGFTRRNKSDALWDDPLHIEYVVSAVGMPNKLFYTQADVNIQPFDAILDEYWTDNDPDDFTVLAWSAPPYAGQPSVSIKSAQTLRSLDQRLSYEVTCTFSSDSKIDILNSEESRKRLIARFPIGDTIETFADAQSVSEQVNVGIEDLTRRNPNTQTLNLHNGEILIVNTKIEVRYLEGQTLKIVPADFGDSGFFSIMLLFSKRIK